MFPPQCKLSFSGSVAGLTLVAATAGVAACGGAETLSTRALQAVLDSLVADSGADVGVVYRSLDGRDSALVNPDIRMHAASTMKVPVMLQVYLDDEAGLLDRRDSVLVETTFRSILDGSAFVLDRASDSDSTLYERAGEAVSRQELVDRMITRSSNLATNLLIQDVDARRVTATLRRLGADSMEVLRGVEDIPAFEAGLSNTTTARDLATVMAALLDDHVSEPGRQEMLSILERQHFRDNIPAGLPPGVRVANKTGWITGINHDAALVFPEAAPPYVLVILLRGHPAEDQGTAFAAEISRVVWAHHTGARSPQ
ncbi:MAG TPA: serine hydrolase [Longimicrobiales bacterium]|nr:serine hydrolase [Longimicrobiales bacterium]